ncbi:MAG: uroporphyrinogen-III synthase [Corynebacterium striatum]|uniref:uroporphyrinogen-III synthase n=1 Tax=uncultured Corynebacterium sp. TaxID=159447 RepID=UPI00288A9E53|nr:uroporphyrinogen-III synthase [uncultured Corynebacterium sp.]MDU3173898.1 uroporphyrinogen-III synthase [Corynebacterium striatum]
MSNAVPDTQSELGKVVFVGAGPGNPDLLTVRAREVLEANAIAIVDEEVSSGIRDVVARAVPVPQELLDAAEEEYARICAEAKEAGARRKPPRPAPPTAAVFYAPQSEDIVAQLREGLVEADGLDVIRLVSGNPLNRESIKEEISAVAAEGLEFQVVPGMSLPSTVPSFAGLALGATYTEADITEGADWDALASATQPLVLQATAADLPVISRELIERGMSADIEAYVTVHGTTRLQRTHETTLGTLGKLDAELPGDLVVTLGRSFDDRSKYSWWENRPLYGWRVLVPRTKEQAAAMSARLAGYGAIPQSVPTISVEPPRNPAQMDRAIKGIVEGRYKWIVFTSVNAVSAVWSKIAELGLDARDFAGVHLAAVGTKTADAIRAKGMVPELLPNKRKQNAEGLVEVFPNYVEDIDAVGRVLLPRADIAGDALVTGLEELGWEVDDVVAYRTVRAAPPSAEIRDMIKSGGFDAVAFTSGSTVRNLVGIAGKPHARTIIACIGPSTKAAAEELGLRVDVVPEVAEVPALIDALAEHVAALRAAGNLPAPRKKRRSRKKATKSA